MESRASAGGYCFQCVDLGVGDSSAQRSSELPLASRVTVMPRDDGCAHAEPGGEKK